MRWRTIDVRLTLYPDPRAFLEAVGPELRDREVEHHLVLGVAMALGPAEPVPVLAAVRDDRGIVLIGLRMDGRPLLLASNRDANARAAEVLCERISVVGTGPRQVIGGASHAVAFAGAWTRLTGRPAHLRMQQRLYVLTSVRPLPRVSGSMRQATADDVDQVSEWLVAFEEEALNPIGLGQLSREGARTRAEQRIAAGELYLWADPEPRAMAGTARPTERGIAINSVYTPPQSRGRGYASACVADLSARMLNAGRAFCVLYTDLANPTSNAIYVRIGYEPVIDLAMYELMA